MTKEQKELIEKAIDGKFDGSMFDRFNLMVMYKLINHIDKRNKTGKNELINLNEVFK